MHQFDVVAVGQKKNNAGRHFMASIVSMWLKSSGTNQKVVKVVLIVDWMCRLPKRVVNKLKTLLK